MLSNKTLKNYLGALVSLISDAKLLGDLVVVSSDSTQLLLDLGLATGQVDVNHGKLVDARLSLLVRQLDGAFHAKGLENKA